VFQLGSVSSPSCTEREETPKTMGVPPHDVPRNHMLCSEASLVLNAVLRAPLALRMPWTLRVRVQEVRNEIQLYELADDGSTPWAASIT